jgi:hypothetical protein
VPSSETISHEIAEGQSNEGASSYLAAGDQRKHKGNVSGFPVAETEAFLPWCVPHKYMSCCSLSRRASVTL